MEISKNKYFRILLVEPQYRVKVGLFCILSLVVFSEVLILAHGNKQLDKLMAEKMLVMRIDAMERALSFSDVRAANRLMTKTAAGEPQYRLRGITISNGVPYAIIDKLVYAEGDIIGEYRIVKITRDSVLLENKSANKMRNLLLTDHSGHENKP